MPPHAVGIGLGILAAGAITAVIAKEVVEHWDEITESYDAFADHMEDEHALYLPRFQDRRPPHASSNAHSFYSGRRAPPSSASQAGRSSSGFSTGREMFTAEAILRSDRFTNISESEAGDSRADIRRATTPPNAHQDTEDSDLRAAMEASLRDLSLGSDFGGAYDTPTYPKSESSFQARDDDGEHKTADKSRRSSQMEPNLMDDVDHWSDTWTMTEGSTQGEPSVSSERGDYDFSDSDESHGEYNRYTEYPHVTQ